MSSNQEENERLEKIEKSITIYRVIAFACIIIGFLCLAVVWYQNKYVHPMKWNEVGDYLGGTMVGFWSLAGLFFIYVAFLGQRLDIQLTKQELAETREIQAKQASTQSQQQFENLFFSLIDTHLKIVADLDTQFLINDEFHGGQVNSNSEGRDVFRDGYREYIEHIPEGKERIAAYESLYIEKRAEFGHYYRFLYRIIDTVDKQIFAKYEDIDSDLPEAKRKKIFQSQNFTIRYQYTSIVRSLLSDEELQLLFYNMLYFNELDFWPMIERYCLLKNIPDGQLKIDNPDYNFHPGAIQKGQNPNFSSIAPPFKNHNA